MSSIGKLSPVEISHLLQQAKLLEAVLNNMSNSPTIDFDGVALDLNLPYGQSAAAAWTATRARLAPGSYIPPAAGIPGPTTAAPATTSEASSDAGNAAAALINPLKRKAEDEEDNGDEADDGAEGASGRDGDE